MPLPHIVAAPTAADLRPDVAVDLLRANGAVVFRGAADVVDFGQVVADFEDRSTCDPSKVPAFSLRSRSGLAGKVARRISRLLAAIPLPWGRAAKDNTRLAPSGGFGINPHNENTFLPLAAPDLVWFHVVDSGADGGQSILVDGPRLLEALTPRARALAQQGLRYETDLVPGQWQAVYGVSGGRELRAALDGVDGLTYDLSSRGELHLDYVVSQISTTGFDHQPTLWTNVLSRRPYREVGTEETERLASGEPVPSWFVQELLDAVAAASVPVELRTGDIVLIDNSRVLHGRTPFADTTRQVVTRCSFLRPSLR